jgi:hypothetical protein
MSRPLADRPMAVILAAIDAQPTFRRSLQRWLLEMDRPGEVIVVDASRDETADEIEELFPGVRVLRRLPGHLVPELWRDGLRATDAELVAFSTLQMVPVADWRKTVLERLEQTGAAAVGGPIIEPSSWYYAQLNAIYLLRYINYLLPLIDSDRVELPGENTVYRRDCLDGLESLWDDGFWEVDINRALRARGERLVMAEGAGVVLDGISGGFTSRLQQRYAHARHYGASRARALGPMARLARIVAAPLVPAVLLQRIVLGLRARGRSVIPWLPALPFLLPLLAAWTLGEARGMGTGLLGARSHRRWRSHVVTCSPVES